MNHTVFITGAAGFVGYHVSERLLQQGYNVIGIDNLNNYYDVSLKQARLSQLKQSANFCFEKLDIAADDFLSKALDLHATHPFAFIIHLAAQAGVRYSLVSPHEYVNSNIYGFLNILELSKKCDLKHLVYASSSSVYGGNTKVPFSVSDPVEYPVSLYAASKRSNELMAFSYSHLFKIPATGIRLFTVYGPWGRPDMAYYKFTESILSGNPIDVFNYGKLSRDFTYIEDIVDALLKLLDLPLQETKSDRFSFETLPPHRILNLGGHNPISLDYFIQLLETYIGKPAIKNYVPMQPGDAVATLADIHDTVNLLGFQPKITPEVGLKNFVDWYLDYVSSN